jgi:hypothetical protein
MYSGQACVPLDIEAIVPQLTDEELVSMISAGKSPIFVRFLELILFRWSWQRDRVVARH